MVVETTRPSIIQQLPSLIIRGEFLMIGCNDHETIALSLLVHRTDRRIAYLRSREIEPSDDLLWCDLQLYEFNALVQRSYSRQTFGRTMDDLKARRLLSTRCIARATYPEALEHIPASMLPDTDILTDSDGLPYIITDDTFGHFTDRAGKARHADHELFPACIKQYRLRVERINTLIEALKY